MDQHLIKIIRKFAQDVVDFNRQRVEEGTPRIYVSGIDPNNAAQVALAQACLQDVIIYNRMRAGEILPSDY